MSIKYICSLDLGSSKLAGCILYFKDKKRIKDIFFESLPVRCINEAKITDIPLLTNSLEQLFNRLKKKSGLKIQRVILNISCHGLITKYNFTIIPLAERSNKLITSADIQRIREQAIALASSWEEEIIMDIPISYNVDDRDGFLNPVGLYAHKLGINLLTIAIKSAYFETLSHIFGKLGYDIKNIFISGMGILRYILEKENLNKGLYIILDIGAQVTDIVAYQDKRIMHIGCISFGGDKLTERIAQEFNLSFELAEELKLNYGTVVESPLKDKEIMIKDYNHYKRIQQSRLNQILNREVNDFLLSLRDYFSKNLENRKIDKIFVYGRTALLDGLLEKMEGELTVPVRMVSYSDFPFLKDLSLSSNLSIPQLLDYANCLNAISQTEWFFSEKSTPINLPTGIFKRIISWVRQLYQEYF